MSTIIAVLTYVQLSSTQTYRNTVLVILVSVKPLNVRSVNKSIYIYSIDFLEKKAEKCDFFFFKSEFYQNIHDFFRKKTWIWNKFYWFSWNKNWKVWFFSKTILILSKYSWFSFRKNMNFLEKKAEKCDFFFKSEFYQNIHDFLRKKTWIWNKFYWFSWKKAEKCDFF